MQMNDNAYVQSTKEKDFWTEKLSGELVKSSFPYDHIMNHGHEGKMEAVGFRLENHSFERLMKLCNASDVNLHMLLVAGVTALLYRYTGHEEVMVGAPIYKQAMEGEFINTLLALRNGLRPEMSFKELLLNVRRSIIDAVENQNYPIEKLLYLFHANRSAEFPLIDVLVLLENIHDRKYIEHISVNTVFSFSRTKEYIEGTLEYNAALFEKATIDRLIGHLTRLLSESAGDMNVRIADLQLISREERECLLYGFNNTNMNYPEFKSIQKLFEEQAEITPQRIAVEFKDQSLTYRELREKSGNLARILKEKGVKGGAVAGIMVNRSLEMAVGILGVLMAGGAYLPLDPEQPEERIQFMLEDSGAKALVTKHDIGSKFTFHGESVYLDGEDGGDDSYPDTPVSPEDPAYIIYTSGTTGQPKGVIVEHRGISNAIRWRKNEYGLSEKDSVLQLFSYTFDGFLTSFFTPLVSGSKSVFIDEQEVKDPAAIKEQITARKITHFICVPTLYAAILDCMGGDEGASLRIVTLAGENVTLGLVKKSLSKNPRLELTNEYGPTENSVVSTIQRNLQHEKEITIGRPIWNTAAYILDKNYNLMPVGVPGELCLSGESLAREYLNNPELTAEKFVANPFVGGSDGVPVETLNVTSLQQTSLQRMYRTGDLARWLPDGRIEFLGRLDHQVKIRGFRIEQEEIEKKLLEYEPVKDAVVLVKSDDYGNNNLWAYITGSDGLTVSGLREHLARYLPDYMIPSRFVKLDAMPIKQNGKLDREKLLEFGENMASGVEYVPPRNSIEESLVNVWQQVLDVEKVGIDDSFISLGGDSIKAIQVLAHLQDQSMKLAMKDLFEYQIIRELGSRVKIMRNEIDQGPVTGEVKLSPVQKWFFGQKLTDMRYFNHSIMLAAKKGFEEKLVRQVFEKIAEHHDALRMVYNFEDAEIIQFNRGTGGKLFAMECFDLRGCEDTEKNVAMLSDNLQAGFDLSSGPLVALGLFKTDDGDHLLIIIHHLVTDGVSWRIILEDFAAGYLQALAGEEIRFPRKTCSYREWVENLYDYAANKRLLSELKYWKGVEGTSVNPLPRDGTSGENRLKDSAMQSFSLTETETFQLLKQVHHAFNTSINDILLTALGMAVRKWTGCGRIAVSLEGHGREEMTSGVNVNRTVGWFTSTYPLILDMESSAEMSLLIKTVKEDIRHVPNAGLDYCLLKYIAPSFGKDDIEFRLKPEIGFNYLGQFDNDLETEVFAVSRLPCGKPISPNSERLVPLEINGVVVDGRLTVSVSYNRYEYFEENITKFLRLYQESLQEIIGYCIARKTEVTPTDIGDKKLSLEEFDDLKGLFDPHKKVKGGRKNDRSA